jgi:hypothetical protein
MQTNETIGEMMPILTKNPLRSPAKRRVLPYWSSVAVHCLILFINFTYSPYLALLIMIAWAVVVAISEQHKLKQIPFNNYFIHWSMIPIGHWLFLLIAKTFSIIPITFDPGFIGMLKSLLVIVVMLMLGPLLLSSTLLIVSILCVIIYRRFGTAIRDSSRVD